jgi:hypothetical protein
MSAVDLALLPALATALAGIGGFVWWIVRVELPSARVSRARLDGAAEQLRELLDEEAERGRLLELNSVWPRWEPLDVALAASGDAADIANGLFARAAGGGATLRYDDERDHWSACVPLHEHGPLVAFVVEDVARERPSDALLAALEIVAADAPPTVGAEHRGGAVCVRFVDSGHWQAYQPCDVCGGGWVDTVFDRPDHAPLARLTAARLLVDADDDEAQDEGLRPCLHCAAR